MPDDKEPLSCIKKVRRVWKSYIFNDLTRANDLKHISGGDHLTADEINLFKSLTEQTNSKKI